MVGRGDRSDVAPTPRHPVPGASVRRPFAERHRDVLLWVLSVALLARGLMGVADTVAIAQGGVRAMPVGQAAVMTGSSPLWPALFAVFALAGAIGLAARARLGWILAVAACLAYLVAGIGDVALVQPGTAIVSPSFALLFTADLIMPAAVLAGLLALHVHFVRVPRARLAISAGRLAGHGRSRG